MTISPASLSGLHIAIANGLNSQPGFRPGSFDSWRVAQSTASWLDSFGLQITPKATAIPPAFLTLLELVRPLMEECDDYRMEAALRACEELIGKGVK